MANSFKANTKGMEFILKNLEKSEGMEIRVGVLGSSERKEGEETNASIGVKHEFGLGVPRRSFLRDPMLKLLPEAEKIVGKAAAKAEKENLTAALNRVGAYLAGQIQKNIANGVPPPNAPSTISQKGSSTPLIDTGQLRASITHDVKKG